MCPYLELRLWIKLNGSVPGAIAKYERNKDRSEQKNSCFTSEVHQSSVVQPDLDSEEGAITHRTSFNFKISFCILEAKK